MSASPPLDDRAMGLFLKIARALEERLDAALEEADLSLAKYSAIKHLALAGEPLALGDLASRMICGRSNITQLVSRLTGDGLVERLEDPRDRRSVRAALTPLGAERQAQGAERVDAVRRELAGILAEVDCDALERALERLTGGGKDEGQRT